MISSFTLSAILSAINGKPGLLAWTGLANFGAFEVETRLYTQAKHSFLQDLNYNWWELVVYCMMGVFGGLSGALFNYLNTKLTVYRQQ